MASSVFSALLKKTLHRAKSIPNLRYIIPTPLLQNPNSRFSSDSSSICVSLSFEPEPEPEPASSAQHEDLRSRIFRLRFPKRSATAAIEKWVGEGRKVTQSELRDIAKDLRRSHRYKHALEISEWMKTHQEFALSDSDYAMRIDLITKVFGVNAAEEFFEGLPSNAKSYEVFNALLHSFARAKQTEKAEGLFEKIKESKFSLNVLTYNEMMTLYISVGQLEKVSLVVEELKIRNVPLDLFTYNLWISASAATLDINGVRRILDEMSNDSNSEEGWVTYMKLADVYLTAGHLLTSDNSLVEHDKTISQREWITYDFLVIFHAGLGNTERINEIWKSLRMTAQRMTSRNYTCVIACYLQLGQLKEAGEVIDQWKLSKAPDFDLSACIRLLDAFMKAGLKEAAEAFRELMLQKNCELTTSFDIQ